jgi:hypothetical protein
VLESTLNTSLSFSLEELLTGDCLFTFQFVKSVYLLLFFFQSIRVLVKDGVSFDIELDDLH